MAIKTIIVISDLHVGASDLDDCDKTLEGHLVAFLTELAARKDCVELVINGDFLDFAQAPPWQGDELEATSPDGLPLCFTEDQSITKFRAISKAHPSIFSAISRFLAAKPDNQLTILPGNHDADFFWGRVRSEFADLVCNKDPSCRGRLRFHLDQVYRPALNQRIWIEHGHQYDPCNHFVVNDKACWSEATPPIFKDGVGQTRLYECVGTRFLLKFLNKLDSLYPFVDNVKPFSRFIRIFGVSALVPGYATVKALVTVYAILKYLSTTVTHKPSDLLGFEQPGKGPEKIWKQLISTMSNSERSDFDRKVRQRGFPIDAGKPLEMYVEKPANAEALMMFLAENIDLLEGMSERSSSLLGMSGEEGKLTLAKGFSLDETRELKRAAAKVLRLPGVTAAIMGHTHEPVDNSTALNYVNTGSWTRYYDFRKGTKLTSWDVLREKSSDSFPYELNYAEINPGQAQPIRKMTFAK